MASEPKSYWDNLPKTERNEIKNALGAYIRTTIGYDALAEKLGVSKQTVYDKVSTLKFSPRLVKKWAIALGCDENLFYTGKDEPSPISYPDLITRILTLEKKVTDLEHRLKSLEK